LCRRMFQRSSIICQRSSIICPFWVPLTHISLNPGWSRSPVGKHTCQILIHYQSHVCEDYLPLCETFRCSVSRPHSCTFRGRSWSKTGSKHSSSKLRLCEWRWRFALSSFWLTNSTELSLSWEDASCLVTQEFQNTIMEPEGSLQCSQEPSTVSYPQPDQTVYTHHPICLKSILILFPLYV
jgi:hypothetical protein